MAKLQWGAAGQRFYESGTDRGVLYIDTVGVAWSGLTSVKESPSGGDPRPYYLDGVKYLNLATAEEFEATIEAFSSPLEFGQCDGTATVRNGLFITQQKRKAFGFAYRTKIGNDVKGLDLGYKIHLVWNALAKPSERSNQSLGGSPSAVSLSWGITTTPPRMTGFRPSAHMVVDSRQTTPSVLTALENMLYGTQSSSARLPSQTELVTLFS